MDIKAGMGCSQQAGRIRSKVDTRKILFHFNKEFNIVIGIMGRITISDIQQYNDSIFFR